MASHNNQTNQKIFYLETLLLFLWEYQSLMFPVPLILWMYLFLLLLQPPRILPKISKCVAIINDSIYFSSYLRCSRAKIPWKNSLCFDFVQDKKLFYSKSVLGVTLQYIVFPPVQYYEFSLWKSFENRTDQRLNIFRNIHYIQKTAVSKCNLQDPQNILFCLLFVAYWLNIRSKTLTFKYLTSSSRWCVSQRRPKVKGVSMRIFVPHSFS